MNSIHLLYEVHLNLLYEKSGGYRKFNSIVERTGLKNFSTSPNFISHALFQSLAISDCIKVIPKNGSIQWRLNIEKTYKKNRQESLFADELINCSCLYEKVLFHKQPLVYYEISEREITTHNSTLNKILPFGLIVDKSVALVENKLSINFFDYEYFCFDRYSWIGAEEPQIQPQFYRVRGTFVGFSYYVHISESKLTYRIQNNEWALIIAFFLLKKSMRNIFIKVDKNLKIRTPAKIPYVLLQHIFLNSERLLITYDYEFTNVNELEINNLFEYLLSR